MSDEAKTSEINKKEKKIETKKTNIKKSLKK